MAFDDEYEGRWGRVSQSFVHSGMLVQKPAFTNAGFRSESSLGCLIGKIKEEATETETNDKQDGGHACLNTAGNVILDVFRPQRHRRHCWF